VAKAVGKLQSQMTSCASSIGQQVREILILCTVILYEVCGVMRRTKKGVKEGWKIIVIVIIIITTS
jgi:hypothetical protein